MYLKMPSYKSLLETPIGQTLIEPRDNFPFLASQWPKVDFDITY